MNEIIMQYSMYGFAFGMIFGILAGIIMMIFIPNRLYVDKVWIEVPYEYTVTAIDIFKHVKNMNCYDFPSFLYKEKDGSTRIIPPKSIFYFRRNKHMRDNEYSVEEWRENLVKLLEKHDLVVINSGTC